MYAIIFGFFAVAGCLIGFSAAKLFFLQRIKTVTDTYEAPGRKQTTVQLHNACAIKLANEIRESGAMRVKETKPGKYQIILRVVK